MNALIEPSTLRQSGFTLIELMVTIALIAIITSIAAPSINTQLANQRVKSTTVLLESALKEAKAESIIKRQDVSVTYDSNATPKTITIRNNSRTLATYDVSDDSTITVTPLAMSAITFQSNKMINANGGVIFTICDSGSINETARQVSVNRIANIQTTTSGSC